MFVNSCAPFVYYGGRLLVVVKNWCLVILHNHNKYIIYTCDHFLNSKQLLWFIFLSPFTEAKANAGRINIDTLRNHPLKVDHQPQQQPLQDIPDEQDPHEKKFNEIENTLAYLLTESKKLNKQLDG